MTKFLLSSVSQYEPRGPGRPLYQRRISSSSPQPYGESVVQCKESQDPTACFTYPPADLWPSPGPAPLHNIPCNGASHLVPQRDILGEILGATLKSVGSSLLYFFEENASNEQIYLQPNSAKEHVFDV